MEHSIHVQKTLNHVQLWRHSKASIGERFRCNIYQETFQSEKIQRACKNKHDNLKNNLLVSAINGHVQTVSASVVCQADICVVTQQQFQHFWMAFFRSKMKRGRLEHITQIIQH